MYVTPFPGPGRKWQVSREGGHHPWWRRAGLEIVYQKTGGLIVAVAVEAREDAFVVGAHTPLFEAMPPQTNTGEAMYAPMPDFQRFLVVKREEEASHPLTVVMNWTAEFER